MSSALPTIEGSTPLHGSSDRTRGSFHHSETVNQVTPSEKDITLDYHSGSHHDIESGKKIIPDNDYDSSFNSTSLYPEINSSTLPHDSGSSHSITSNEKPIVPGPAVGNSSFISYDNIYDTYDYGDYDEDDDYEYDYNEDDYAYDYYPQDGVLHKKEFRHKTNNNFTIPTSKPAKSSSIYSNLPYPRNSNKVDVFTLSKRNYYPRSKVKSYQQTVNRNHRSLKSAELEGSKKIQKSKIYKGTKSKTDTNKPKSEKLKSKLNKNRKGSVSVKNIKRKKTQPLKLYDKKNLRKQRKRTKRSFGTNIFLKEDLTWI